MNLKSKIFKNSFLLLLLINVASACLSQRLAVLEIATTGEELFPAPVEIDLDKVTFLPENELELFEVTGGKKAIVNFQVEAANTRVMHWLIHPSKNKKRIFELIRGTRKNEAPAMQATYQNGALILSNNSRNLLQYNFKTVYPPKGVDTVFRRSGFIHPLWTPHGQELTRINAPDHYHHWGLWNPWTKVLFEKDTVDFWNLAERKGTVRFAGFTSVKEGNVFAGYDALHQHVVFKKDGSEKVAINELQSVKIYEASPEKNYYIADITVRLNCATASPVTLLEYRYGSLGIRTTEAWNKDNSSVITSEGKTKKDADGSTARWVMVQGNLGKETGGLSMMSYPANYNYPEPLRVWPENANKRGDVFLNFSPTKNKDWLLEPGKDYILKYRFLIFNYAVSKEQAESAWQSFAHPPAINLNLEKDD